MMMELLYDYGNGDFVLHDELLLIGVLLFEEESIEIEILA
jgi:hypothetical protein